MKNNRKNRRHHVEAFVKIRGGLHEYVFRTRDLSKDGLFLYTKAVRHYPFKVGDELDLELYDYNQHVLCKVEVVRLVEVGSEEAQTFPCGFGVKIIKIEDISVRKLSALLDKVEQGKVLY